MRINGDLEFVAAGSGVLKNAVIESFASDPGSGVVAGRIYYNTTNDEYRYYDGTQWQVFGTGGTAGGIQTELDDTQASLGSFINSDGTFNETDLNALGNISGLTGSDTLLDALSQLDAAITAAAGVDTLAELTDTTITGPTDDEILQYDTGVWVNKGRDAANLVTKETPQTISGAKTFSANTTFTATATLAAGSESAPSLFFTGDSNTGLYHSAADELSITAGGNQIARFGDAIINATYPGIEVSGWIEVGSAVWGYAGGAAAPTFAFSGYTDSGVFFDGGGESGDIGFASGGTALLYWDASRNVWTVDKTTDYEQQVDNDDDIPNKKYVDDAIAASAVASLDDIGDVTITAAATNDFLVFTGTQWEDRTPTQARAAMDVYSTTEADTNFVNVAGDTMTGDLTMSGANIVADSGAAATPSVTFTGDTDTGLSAAAANTLVLSAGGTGIVTVGTGSVTLTQELLAPAGTAGAPAVSFSGDTDTGMFSGGTNVLAFSAGGQESLNIEGDGTLNVAAVTNYETLVTADDDIPNKKYVDDAISNGLSVTDLEDLNNVDAALRPDNSFLVYNSGTTSWEDETPATARTTLGLVSGGAGDIWVEKTGDTMSGNLDMGSNSITNLASPSAGTDAANKTYVDNLVTGLSVKPAVKVATTANLTATYDNGTAGVGATLTATSNGAWPGLDGVTTGFALQDGILVKDQTNAFENGRYYISDLGSAGTPWVLTRCGTCDEADEIPSSFVFVQQGTTYGNTGWAASVDDPTTFTVGTDDIDWLQFSGSGSITAGTGLDLVGTTLNVNLGAGIFELPTDEVGIELHDDATGAIILTDDGSTRATTASSKLHLLLDSNGSLTQGAGGLSVAASTFTGDTGSDATILPGEAMNFIGGTGLSSTVAANGSDVDVTFDAAVATEAASQGAGTLGIAEFADGDFVVTSGFVELDPVGVQESISLTFSPETGTDVVLTGATDTLNIDSDTLTVSGAGTTITIDLNADVSDLNDVDVTVGDTSVTQPGVRDRVYYSASSVWNEDLLGYSAGVTAPVAGYYAAGIQRGAQLMAWDPVSQTWVEMWSDAILNAVGMNGFNEWEANSTILSDETTRATVTGSAWSATATDNEAGAVFARWDLSSGAWRNFTPAQMVDMLNAEGGLTGISGSITLAGDGGTPQTVDFGDTLTVAGGTGISTVAGATDTVTVSLSASINDLNDVIITGAGAGDVLRYDGGDWVNSAIHYVESSASASSHVITHNLGQQYVNVTVVDTNDEVIIPQSISMDSSTQLTVTLSSAAAITVIVTGVAGV